MSFRHWRTRLWTERVSLGARNRQMNRMTMRTSSFSGTSHRRPSSSATADPGREPSCSQGSRHGGGMSRPRISRTHLGVYADRMYGSDILCSRELLSRGQSELQPFLIKLGGFFGAPSTAHRLDILPSFFRALRPVRSNRWISEFSESSVCPGEARTKIRAEPSSNGCAGLLRTTNPS